MNAPVPRRLILVQMLRGGAAFSVALLHILHETLDPGGSAAGWAAYVPLGAGVDLFFVISGFVVIHASRELFGQAGNVGVFLGRRLARIVPLYWAATTVFLATVLVTPGSIHGVLGGPAYLVASYLFIPWTRPDGLVQPAYGLGWTLNYEMFFYVAVACVIPLKRSRAVPLLMATLALFVVWGAWAAPHDTPLRYWSAPIVLEFLFGVGIAHGLFGRTRLGPGAQGAMAALAIGLMLCRTDRLGLDRAFAFGLPAALLVTAAVCGSGQIARSKLSRGLVVLGDASYALYLLHPFAMRPVGLAHPVFARLGAVGDMIAILLSLLLAIAMALVVHRFFERPVAALFRRRGAMGQP